MTSNSVCSEMVYGSKMVYVLKSECIREKPSSKPWFFFSEYIVIFSCVLKLTLGVKCIMFNKSLILCYSGIKFLVKP